MKIKSVETIEGEFEIECIPPGASIEYEGVKLQNSQEVSYPDIDYDCSSNESVRDELMSLWGEDCVAYISNWNTLQLKSLIKDISKFYGIPFQEVNEVTTVMSIEATPICKEKHGIKSGVYTPTFEELLEYSNSLKAFLKKYPQIAIHVNNLKGQIRSASTHAGGCVVSENLSSVMPLIRVHGRNQTPWPEGQKVRQLETLGFIKFDILGLSTLRIFERAIELVLKKRLNIESPSFEDVKKFYDDNLHPNKINFDDQKVYEFVFHKGNFAGTFQFAEKGLQDFTKQVKPKSLKELTDLNALWRPGPLGAGVSNNYLEAVQNPEMIKYDHEVIKEVLDKNYGFILYQEDLAWLAHKLGKNISLQEGNLLRKILIKRGTGKGHELKDSIHKRFIEGCEEKGLAKNKAQKLWDDMELFSQYAFNLSHSLCYSMVAFQCAWLLTYYTGEWLCAYLDEASEEEKEMAIRDAKSMGFKIKSVNINESGLTWDFKDNVLLQPLNSIKGLGQVSAEYLVRHRPFDKIEDIVFNENIPATKVNKKNLDVLIRSGACDTLIKNQFTNQKHLWLSIAFETRPKSLKQLEKNVNLYKDEKDFSLDERLNNILSLTGVFPFEMIIDQKILNRIAYNKIPPINKFDSALGVCWFVLRNIEWKKTASNREYIVLSVIDDSSKEVKIKCWNVKKNIDLFVNHIYLAKLELDPRWGFSTRALNKSLKLLG